MFKFSDHTESHIEQRRSDREKENVTQWIKVQESMDICFCFENKLV